MSKNYYSIAIMRRLHPDKWQLNFTDKEAANNVFAGIGSLKDGENKVFVDSFGSKIRVDGSDLSHVVFVDHAASIEFSVGHAELTNRLTADYRRQVEAANLAHGRLLMPGPGMPQA